MTKKQLKKNMRVWCQWKSRYLYFVGMVGDKYKFIDICDAITIVNEAQLSRLIVK